MKVWTWMIRYAEDKVWEMSSKPEIFNLEEDFLTSVKFGEKPVIEVAITHLRSILFLFNDEDSAKSFQEGFRYGRAIQEDTGEIWQTKLDHFKECNSFPDLYSNRQVYKSGEIEGFEI